MDDHQEKILPILVIYEKKFWLQLSLIQHRASQTRSVLEDIFGEEEITNIVKIHLAIISLQSNKLPKPNILFLTRGDLQLEQAKPTIGLSQSGLTRQNMNNLKVVDLPQFIRFSYLNEFA